MVAAGRTDFTLDDEAVLKAELNKHADLAGKLEIDTKPLVSNPCYLGISRKAKNKDQLKKALEDALKAMKQDGTIKKICTSHQL